MIEGILLENALEEILKRADRITDTKKVKVEEANGFCLAENIYACLLYTSKKGGGDPPHDRRNEFYSSGKAG